MRYYRHRRKASQKAKTIFFRILFVLTAAVVITGMAILTGKALLNKVEKATEELESSVPPSGNAAGRVNRDESDLAEEAYSSLQVFAAGLDLPYHETEDSLFARIHTIAESCDTVSVKVTGQSGLLYTSPALSELVRMPAVTGDNPLYDRLSLTVTAAKARNLRLSAVMTSSLRMLESATAALVDSTIAAELYAMGFQEILLTDILPYDADTDTINNARWYLQSMQNTLSGSGSFSVGACLPVSVYLDAVNAKQVQMLASSVDFLAMDAADLPVSSANGMTLEEVCLSLAGSFQVYNLRVLLTAEDPALLAAQYNTLVRMDIANIHFLGEVSPGTLAEAVLPESEQTPAETTEEEMIPSSNPYATTLPEDGAGSGTEDAVETDPAETFYRTEGGSWY
ncbi:MAG: hypothetical protein IJX14_10680 [Clostridia bacterium]|nr:hypothetical protein [Clostridia bacterium]